MASISITIITHNNSESILTMLRHIKRHTDFFDVTVSVYDFGSDIGNSVNNISACNWMGANYTRVVDNDSYDNYYRLLNRAFRELPKKSDYYFVLPDTVELSDNYFTESIRLYNAIQSPLKICLNTSVEDKRILWNKFKAQELGDYSITQWVNSCFMCTGAFFKVIGDFNINVMWQNDSIFGHGATHYMSNKIIDEGYQIFQVKESLVKFKPFSQASTKSKVIVIVQSSLQKPYNEFMQTQKETWGSVGNNNVKVIWYVAGKKEGFKDNVLTVKCPATYDKQHWKTKLCLDFISDMDYDFVFNTHASSYINKRLLLEAANMLPKEEIYIGSYGGFHNFFNFVSGSGHFWSKDVIVKIREVSTIKGCVSSDVILSMLLSSRGIKLNFALPRLDYKESNSPCDADTYHHIRFNDTSKGGPYKQDITSRREDMKRMRQVHEYLVEQNLI